MSLHPVETVLLPSLQNVRKAPARAGALAAWRASCPLHDSKNNDLSIAISSSFAPLVHCFCKHSPTEVFESLGIDWTDLHPRNIKQNNMPHAAKGNGGPGSWSSLAAAVDALHAAHCRLLATCSLAMEAGEIEAALSELLVAGEAMQAVKDMARRAMREGAK
jgi:hypothetical protein